jgi:hypothetical protein
VVHNEIQRKSRRERVLKIAGSRGGRRRPAGWQASEAGGLNEQESAFSRFPCLEAGLLSAGMGRQNPLEKMIIIIQIFHSDIIYNISRFASLDKNDHRPSKSPPSRAILRRLWKS